MRCTVREDGGWTVVAVTGVVDVATAPDLRSRLHELQVGTGSRVLVDLDAVELVDSFGVGVLLEANTRARAGDGRLVLVVTRERLRRVFDRAGLDTTFELVGTPEEVLGA